MQSISKKISWFDVLLIGNIVIFFSFNYCRVVYLVKSVLMIISSSLGLQLSYFTIIVTIISLSIIANLIAYTVFNTGNFYNIINLTFQKLLNFTVHFS